MYTKIGFKFLSLVLLVVTLAACGRQSPKFVAPEIEPSPDLIPAYVPEGFNLVNGYQIKMGEFEARSFQPNINGDDNDKRIACKLDLSSTFFGLQSPAGNDIVGVHYESKDALLLITKSYYPGGSFDLWHTSYATVEKDTSDDCGCNCDCIELFISNPISLRDAEIKEVRTIDDTQVAVFEKADGWVTVFVRNEYLFSVGSSISLEENLKVVESLLSST